MNIKQAKIMFRIIVVTMTAILCITLAYGTLLDKKSNSEKLRASMDIPLEEAKQVGEMVFKEEAMDILKSNKDKLFTTPLSDEDIADCTLSESIPVFSQIEKARKGNKFKSKLKLVSWIFLIQHGEKPIAVIELGRDGKKIVLNNVTIEEFAKNIKLTGDKLKTSETDTSAEITEAVCTEVVGIKVVRSPISSLIYDGRLYFAVNALDEVALVQGEKPMKDMEGTDVVKTFDELMEAADKATNYYLNQKEALFGDNLTINYLYNINVPADVQKKNTTMPIGLALGVVGLVGVVLISILLYKRKINR